MTIYCEWRAFLGPRYRPAGDTYYYPWHQIEIDAATDLTSAATTLASSLADGAVSASLTSGTNFATTGGVWIGPVSAGQGWEYVDYHTKSGNSLPNLVRESSETREHNGAHASGAVVRQFWPLECNDGRLQFLNELDDNLAANDWRATISGVAFPQAALRNNHLIVIQTRTTPTGAWGNFLVGFVRAPRAVDTYEHTGQWKVEIASAAGMLRRAQADSVRAGSFSLSSACKATSSTPLSSARRERASGDYAEAEPTFDADNVLDGDLTTLWISDRLVGTKNTTDGHDRSFGQIGPSQLYINPPTGYTEGYRWVELTNIGLGTRVPVVWNTAEATEYQLVDIEGLNKSAAGDDEYVILCEDKALFSRDNPSQQALRVHGVNESSNGGSRAWFSHFDPAGGALALKISTPSDSYEGVVCWGTQTGKPFGTSADVTDYATEWDEHAVDAPATDETIRRNHISAATPEYAKWSAGNDQSPAYTIDNSDEVWLRVDVPGMDLRLRDDITTGTTTIYVVDAAGRPTTDGLPSSGTLVIGEDEISYTGKTSEALTGVTAITSSHAEGDTLYIKAVSAYVTDAYPISSISLRRSGGTIYLADFSIYCSPYATARNPGDSNWENDYPWTDAITGNSGATYTVVADDVNPGATSVRARTIVIRFKKMTTDPARARLNELDIYLQSSFFDAGTWIAADSPEALISAVLQNGGLSSGAIVTYESLYSLDNLATDTGPAFDVAADLADYAGSRIQVQRDSDMILSANTLWSTAVGGYTPDRTWTAADVAAVDFAWLGAANVAQVRMAWKTHDASAQTAEEYPSTPADEGQIVDVGPLLFASSTEAALAARKRYYLAQYPYEIVIELAGGNNAPEPGEIHRLNGWTLDSTVGAIDRLYLIRSVEHTIEYDTEAGHPVLATVLSGIEIDREAI